MILQASIIIPKPSLLQTQKAYSSFSQIIHSILWPQCFFYYDYVLSILKEDLTSRLITVYCTLDDFDSTFFVISSSQIQFSVKLVQPYWWLDYALNLVINSARTHFFSVCIH